MNYALARDYYSRKQTTTIVSEASAHQLITLTLNKLKADLVLFRETGEKIKTRSARVSILSALQLLQGSLDFEKGGDIANNLFQLYEFARQRLLEDLRACKNEGTLQAIEFLGEIRDAWEEMGKQNEQNGRD